MQRHIPKNGDSKASLKAEKAAETSKRVINYLRVSVTDLCNYRCTYCMPPEGVRRLPHSEILSFEEICEVVSAAIPLGINRVRLTGGEPLVRRGVPELVRMLTHLPGIEEVYLTTNGSLLHKYAHVLRANGLSRINVSLDSLKADRFHDITRGGNLEEVWNGIETAVSAGFEPVKLNVVVIKGVNDDEIEEFAALSMERPFEVRFIEYMPFGPEDSLENYECVTADEMKKRIREIGNLKRLPGVSQSGPAERYKLERARGVIGFIPAMSHSFCSTCNRIRLTADGRLLSCLFSGRSVEVKSFLRSGAEAERISDALRLAIDSKPSIRAERCESFMGSIGG
jgi:cyclic pyranopterin phosphate synthase